MSTSVSGFNSKASATSTQSLDLGSLGKLLVDTATTAATLSVLNALDRLTSPQGLGCFERCHCACEPDLGILPFPDLSLSGAPAGQGLETGPTGWPPGSVKTAGGYVIAPEGKDCAWSVYGPDQCPGDQPLTRIWGDPHVSENDGDRWDFTKDSDFVLPDGTRIHCNTSSETGQSVTTSLTIVNGQDRVEITGINSRCPSTSEVKSDGYEWRAQHNQRGVDSFHLGGTADEAAWFKVENGFDKGEVTGAHYDHCTNRYEQVTDGNKKYWVDPELQPEFGTEAWGNEIRGRFIDILDDLGVPADMAQAMAKIVDIDHSLAEIQGQLEELFAQFLPMFLFSQLSSSFSNDSRQAVSDLRHQGRELRSFSLSTLSLQGAVA